MDGDCMIGRCGHFLLGCIARVFSFCCSILGVVGICMLERRAVVGYIKRDVVMCNLKVVCGKLVGLDREPRYEYGFLS